MSESSFIIKLKADYGAKNSLCNYYAFSKSKFGIENFRNLKNVNTFPLEYISNFPSINTNFLKPCDIVSYFKKHKSAFSFYYDGKTTSIALIGKLSNSKQIFKIDYFSYNHLTYSDFEQWFELILNSIYMYSKGNVNRISFSQNSANLDFIKILHDNNINITYDCKNKLYYLFVDCFESDRHENNISFLNSYNAEYINEYISNSKLIKLKKL